MNKIWNPLKKKFVSIHSTSGKHTLRDYLQHYNTQNMQFGGAVIDVIKVSGIMNKKEINMKNLIEAYKRAGDVGVISTFDKSHAICKETNILLTRDQYKSLKDKKTHEFHNNIFRLKIGSEGFYKKNSQHYKNIAKNIYYKLLKIPLDHVNIHSIMLNILPQESNSDALPSSGDFPSKFTTISPSGTR